MSFNTHNNNYSNIFTFGIRQKILLILITILTTTLTISGWFSLEKEKKDVLTEINKRGNDISRIISKSLVYSVIGYDYHSIQLLLDEITASEELTYAKVTNINGNTMAESGNINQNKKNSLVMFTNNITLKNEVIGVLKLGINTMNISNRINSEYDTKLKREFLVILIIALVEFLALSYAIIRPVKLMTNSLVNNIDKNGIIKAELPIISNDEFSLLARQFNHLRSQLNHANEQLHSKIDLADKKLQQTNQHLLKQSDELKILNDELQRLSCTDALTGIFNRRHFDGLMKTEVEMSLRHSDPNSLLLVDIDFFKKINDTYGHDAGDAILVEVAKIMQSLLRSTDILCRIGGEEFIVLCKRATPTDALEVGEKLRSVVEQHEFLYKNILIKVTISIGAASIPDQEKIITANEFYKYADKALYVSKKTGRNRITHYNSIRTGNEPDNV